MSEANFTTLFEQLPDPVWIMVGRRFVEANPAALACIGFTQRPMMLRLHPAELSPERQPDGEASLAKAERMMDIAEQRGIHRFEWVHQRQDGSHFPAEVTLTAITWAGQPALCCIWRDMTQRDRARKLLENLEAVAGIGGWELDLSSGLIHWTNQVYQIHELPLGEPIKLDQGISFYAPEARPVIEQAISRAIAEGVPWDLELPFITAKGRQRWVRTVGQADCREGCVTRLFGAFYDVTDRHGAEVALRDSEAALKRAQKVAKVGSWWLDLKQNRLIWSEQAYQIFGIPQERALTYEAFLDTVHPDDRAAVDGAWQAALAGAPYAIDHRIVVNGVVKWVSERAELEWDGAGELLAGLGTVQDITERKLAESELRVAASVYEALSEGVFMVDADNRIVSVNPAFTVLTGYTAEDAMGQDPKLLQSGCHDTAFFNALWHSLETTGQWQGEIINRRKNGEVFTEWLSIQTVHDAQGRLLRRIGLFTDISERKRNEVRIWRQANYDELTGLVNRQFFRDRLEQDIRRARRADSMLGLLFIDLDRFKEVNDTVGHAMGDQVLVAVAERILFCIRKSDTLARMGGDEFTVIMTDMVSTDRVGEVAQIIVDTLAQPFHLGGEAIYLTASIGIALYPADGTAVTDLMQHADQAMYAAKQRRNQICFFTPELHSAAIGRRRMIDDLRESLALGHFELHYQPIVELKSGRIDKAEALVRWRHPVRGLVLPDEFIPVAESCGLINELGDWVFREAARWVQTRQGRSEALFQVSINKSPVQFLTGHTEDSWPLWLQTIGLTGDTIVIEVTEGLLFSNRQEMLEKLAKFHSAGITLAIDDFGTGYSALAYLKKFKADFLKIDGSFIRDLVSNPADRALVEAIIVMAHKLGLRVIAEGVETMEQRDWLAAADCDYAQGFLFAPPAPAGAIDW